MHDHWASPLYVVFGLHIFVLACSSVACWEQLITSLFQQLQLHAAQCKSSKKQTDLRRLVSLRNSFLHQQLLFRSCFAMKNHHKINSGTQKHWWMVWIAIDQKINILFLQTSGFWKNNSFGRLCKCEVSGKKTFCTPCTTGVQLLTLTGQPSRHLLLTENGKMQATKLEMKPTTKQRWWERSKQVDSFNWAGSAC